MKMKRVVQMVSATTDTGRLACDMYDLDAKEYYSDSKREYLSIADMDFQHLVRAFVKQNDEDIRNDTQEGKIVDVIKAKDKIINSLQEQLEEKDQQWSTYSSMLARQRDMYRNIASEVHRTNGCAYTFSEVPQDEEGKEFVKNCKKYLNKESYAIRVRGQHLKKDLYGQGRASWGANMEDSSHMRVYIDKKRGDE